MRSDDASGGVRLDKWLWAARFFKTRGIAADEIGRGRVSVNGVVAKASRTLQPGHEVAFRQGQTPRTVRVVALALQRGPAPVASALYEETAESLAARAEAEQRRRIAPDPGHALAHGRPTKRDRRQLVDWDRWSAKADE